MNSLKSSKKFHYLRGLADGLDLEDTKKKKTNDRNNKCNWGK